jgi:hypothetical protein
MTNWTLDCSTADVGDILDGLSSHSLSTIDLDMDVVWAHSFLFLKRLASLTSSGFIEGFVDNSTFWSTIKNVLRL